MKEPEVLNNVKCCPFCGKQPNACMLFDWYGVWCCNIKCGVRPKSMCNTRAKALEAWNTRAAEREGTRGMNLSRKTGDKVMESEHNPKEKDWMNREITHEEKPTDMIWIWECEPSTDREVDSIWIREYQKALDYIRDAFEMSSDGWSPEELKGGEVISGSMRLREVSLMDYESLGENQ